MVAVERHKMRCDCTAAPILLPQFQPMGVSVLMGQQRRRSLPSVGDDGGYLSNYLWLLDVVLLVAVTYRCLLLLLFDLTP